MCEKSHIASGYVWISWCFVKKKKGVGQVSIVLYDAKGKTIDEWVFIV